MFCYQCEQTAKGKGCTKIGVCGKKPELAALQDLLIDALKGLSQAAVAGQKAGVVDDAVGPFTCEALFSTLTNVNFNAARFNALYNAYASAPEVTRTRLYLEMLGTVLPNVKDKIVLDEDLKGVLPLLDLTNRAGGQ